VWRQAWLPSWSGGCSGFTCVGLLPRRTVPRGGRRIRGRPHFPQAGGGEKTLQAYTVEQVAKMLHVGRDKVYYLLRTGQLRSLKIGKLRRITEQQLAEFIASLDYAG
jgi:excisionase family DNA binding protein